MSKVSETKIPLEPKVFWWCETCYSAEMDYDQLRAHLKGRHGLESAGLKCRQRMMKHGDAERWFKIKNQITIDAQEGEIVLTGRVVHFAIRPEEG